MRLKPPDRALIRREHSLLAMALLGLCAVILVLVSPLGRHAIASIDRCTITGSTNTLDFPLPHLAARLAAGGPVTIIAFGSSSTYGTGASGPHKTYPKRLEVILNQRYPTVPIRVLNRGVGGEVASNTLQRIDTDAIADHPDLVIWQVGTNDVLRDIDPAAAEELIRAGIARMKQAGIDVVLMDLQFAPAILQHPRYRDMERDIAAVARAEDVPVIHRFAMMRQWAEAGRMPLSLMLAFDRLHMTDLSYDCLARQVSGSLASAVRRKA